MTLRELRKRMAKTAAEFREALSYVEDTRNEAQDYYDERSESWQEGEKGEEYQGAIDTLDDAISELDTAIGRLEEISS